MRYTLSETDFSTAGAVWKSRLWPKRVEPIEARSALLFKKGFDLNYQSAEVFFVKAAADQQIVGVCSGQRTGPKEFRSRGLWVAENYRKKGIGGALFRFVEEEAKRRGGLHLWTLARYSSKEFYLSMGMKSAGKTGKFEYGPHFYMSKKLNEPDTAGAGRGRLFQHKIRFKRLLKFGQS